MLHPFLSRNIEDGNAWAGQRQLSRVSRAELLLPLPGSSPADSRATASRPRAGGPHRADRHGLRLPASADELTYDELVAIRRGQYLGRRSPGHARLPIGDASGAEQLAAEQLRRHLEAEDRLRAQQSAPRAQDDSARVIQQSFRRYQSLAEQRAQSRHRSEEAILALSRGYVYRRRFVLARSGCIGIQAAARGWLARERLRRQLLAAHRRERIPLAHSSRANAGGGRYVEPQDRQRVRGMHHRSGRLQTEFSDTHTSGKIESWLESQPYTRPQRHSRSSGRAAGRHGDPARAPFEDASRSTGSASFRRPGADGGITDLPARRVRTVASARRGQSGGPSAVPAVHRRRSTLRLPPRDQGAQAFRDDRLRGSAGHRRSEEAVMTMQAWRRGAVCRRRLRWRVPQELMKQIRDMTELQSKLSDPRLVARVGQRLEAKKLELAKLVEAEGGGGHQLHRPTATEGALSAGRRIQYRALRPTAAAAAGGRMVGRRPLGQALGGSATAARDEHPPAGAAWHHSRTHPRASASRVLATGNAIDSTELIERMDAELAHRTQVYGSYSSSRASRAHWQ
jgi:hypothetical protein